MKTSSIAIAGVVILVVGIFMGIYIPARSVGGNGGLTAAKCSVTTSSLAAVGNQLSSTILAANETRAWATIEVQNGATSTIALSFDEGAAATLTAGYSLNATSTNGHPTPMDIAFGRSTPFPYTGAVTGITNFGSTTVKVTECAY